VGSELQELWRRHADDADRVFGGAVALAARCDGAEVPGVVGLIVHVGAEHLRRDGEVSAALDAVERRFPGTPAVARSRLALAAVADGSIGALGALSPEDEARALAVVSGLAGDRGLDALASAVVGRMTQLSGKLPAGGDAVRAVAAAGNNLACVLELREARTAEADATLRAAALLARTTWERAGTWVEVERAEYRLAMTHLALGDPQAAVAHAETCLAICRGNGGDPGELVFACAAVGRACAAAGATRRAREALTWGRALVDAPDFPGDLRDAARQALEQVRLS
jgi:hypothetical protein